ncbi:MAG: FG-GAP-like repeat-containing protein [Bacteroidota bacterium]
MSYKLLLFSLVIFFATNAFCQAPTITHVDKYINGNGQRVTISGSNFGGNPSNLSIWFGAVKATTIQTATDQTIEVLVPPGATYETINVTNTSTNKSASSGEAFMLSYGGQSPIALSNLVAQTNLDAETGLYDLCMCDLDGDGLSDVAGANAGGVSAPANGVSVFRNTTATPGTFSFAPKVSFLPSTKTLNIKCGDLNGDGKKELIISESDPGTRVFILKNTSTPGNLSFTSQNLSIAGTSPKRVDLADLDGDGLPELVVTDQNTGNKDFIILPNTSSGGTISFGTHITLPVEGTGSDGLTIQDVDGDNKLDIVVSQFLSSSGNVYVYQNKSHPGSFDFSHVVKADVAPGNPSNTGAPMNVRLADIDGDSKPDIAVTHFLGSKISVLLNQSTSTEVKFGTPVAIPTDPYPFGLDIGDLDGDGKPDVVVASLTGPTPNAKSLTILNNTSSSGSVSFTRLTQPTTFINRHVVVGDIDGDSKPDIVYASVDDNTNGIPASKISFFRNKSCIVPKVTPEGPMVVCASFPVILEATVSTGATYEWKKDGVSTGISTSTLTPSLSGTYTVDITSDGCTQTSNSVDVTVSAGAATSPSFTPSTSLVCAGGTITITASSTGATAYNWTGPQNFTATGATITRGSYVPEFAGRYEVEVMAGGCIAAKGSTLVETISLPAFAVGFTGSDVFCSGTKALTAIPNDANFTYQWADANGDIASATSSTFNASGSGTYYVKAKSIPYTGCPVVTSESTSIVLAATPVVAFNSPVETCKDSPTSFDNQSTLQADAGPNYSWDFGDAGTSTTEDATHTYTTVGDLTVKLTASYRGNACPTVLTKPIKISLAPVAAITAPNNVFQICDGDEITLSVTPAFSEYLWSNSETTPTIDVNHGGTYSVQVKSSIGCKINASAVVTALVVPEPTLTATPNSINEGETSELSVEETFDSYLWTPAETLTSDNAQQTTAKPAITTTYTVTVVGDNGCPGKSTVTVTVIQADPLSLLKVANFFSPNGDLTNPTWSIGSGNAVVCGVTIFDEKGSKVFEASPYNNDWDGTSNGKKLPDGVYYYIIKCDNGNGSKTGSITILR